MKGLIAITALLTMILYGCSPSSNFYQTPPVYFSSSHNIPATDSTMDLAASATVVVPANVELKTEYRVSKMFLLNFSYYGNFWGYSEYSANEFDYRYHTQSFNFGAGLEGSTKNNEIKWFALANYSLGKTTSIVPEYDNSIEFVYKGKFSGFRLTEGLVFKPDKDYDLTLSTRQSFIRFSKYQLPDTSFQNKYQFLSDLMFGFTVIQKRISLELFLGCFLNGSIAGNRLQDNKIDTWRIARWYAGGGFSYKFSLR